METVLEKEKVEEAKDVPEAVAHRYRLEDIRRLEVGIVESIVAVCGYVQRTKLKASENPAIKRCPECVALWLKGKAL